MSLSALKPDSRTYTVICNILDNENPIDDRNIIKEINLDNYQDKIDEFNSYNTTSVNIKYLALLFVGEYTDEINSILKTINSSSDFIGISQDNKDILDKFFGYDINNQWNSINNESIEKIYFVPHLIHHFDNVGYLHTLISTVLSSFTKLEEPRYRLLVTPDELYLYTQNSLNIDIEYDNFVNNLLMDQQNKNFSFDQSDVIMYFNQFGIDQQITDLLLEKYDNNMDNLHELMNDDILKYIFFSINSYVSLSNKVKFKKDNIFFPNNINYFLSKFSTNIYDNSYKTYNNNKNKLLGNITNSSIIYTYSQINVQRYISEKFSTNEIDNETIYGHIYKYLFPNSKVKMTEIISNNIIENYSSIINNYDLLKYHLSILDIFSNFNLNSDDFIDIIDIEPMVYNIKSSLNLPNNYSLLEMFNSIPLSLQYPFSKYKDVSAGNIVYKIFKPITISEDIGYEPYVTKDTLVSWTKYRNYEIDNYKIKNIKGNPRELFYKLLISTNYNTSILKGIISKIHHIDDQTFYDIRVGETIYNNIESDVDKGNIINEDGSELDIDIEVSFKSKKEIYADIEIFKKNIIHVSVNTSEFTNEIGDELLEDIVEKVNKFLKYIYKEDRKLVSYQKYYKPIDSSNIIFNNSFQITLGNIHRPIYDDFFNTLDMVYPLIDIPEESFNIGDKVYYFDLETSKDRRYQSIITSKDERKNTYTIKYRDDDMNEIQKDSILPRYLSSADKIDKSFVSFDLKLIKGLNYDKKDKVLAFIDKSRLLGLNEKEIINRLVENFDELDTAEKAQNKLTDFLSITGLSSISSNVQVNPKITIDWSSIKEIESEDEEDMKYSVSIFVENIQDSDSIIQVKNLLLLIFDLYNTSIDNSSSSNDKIKALLESTSLEEVRDKKEQVINIIPDTKIIEEDENEDDDLSFLDDDYNSDDEGDDKSVASSYKTMKIKEQVQKALKDDSIIIGQNRLTKNAILDNLYARDPDLFYWEDKQLLGKRAYTGVCQGTKRYPKVLTDDQKNKIDIRDKEYFKSAKYKDIISRYPDYIQEDENYRTYNTSFNDDPNCTSTNYPEKTRKCSAYRYGSSPENQNWYTCPKIFDIKDNVPLHWTMLDYIEIDGDTFYPLNYNHIDKWRTDKRTGKDILEFKPTYKNRGPINQKKSRIAPTSKNSLIFLEKRVKYSYPGFLEPSVNPLSLYTPCCFNNNSKRLKEAFTKEVKTSTRTSINYIQGVKKELAYNPRRIGLVPDVISNMLNNDNTKCITGDLTDSKKCFFRVGNKQGSDSYLSLMSQIFFDSYDADFAKDYIVNIITPDEYKFINNGTLDIKFRNYGHQTSFQNFIEYTLSNQQKDYQDYFEFFSILRPGYLQEKNSKVYNTIISDNERYGIATNDISYLNIIFETERVNNDIRYKVVCPYFSNNIRDKLLNVTHVSLTIKNNNIYEPIYFFNGNSRPKKIFRIGKKTRSGTVIPSDNKYVTNIFNKLIQICSSETPSNIFEITKFLGKQTIEKNFTVIDFFRLLIYSNKHNLFNKDSEFNVLKPKVILLDDYNRIYGIVLDNNSIIPIYPESVNISLINLFKAKFKSAKLIYTPMSDSKITYKKVNLNTHLDSYRLLEKLYDTLIELESNQAIKDGLKKIEIKIIYYFEEDKMINGFISESGSYIDILPQRTPSNISKIIKNNYTSVDKSIINHQKMLFESIYKEPIPIEKLIEILDDIDPPQLKEYFNIVSYLVNNDKIIGLITNKNCIIHISDLEISELDKYYPELILHRGEFVISNLYDYLEDTKEMYKLSNSNIPMVINNYLMSKTKTIDRVVLDTGMIIKLVPEEQFRINQKRDSEYLINILLNKLFNEKAEYKLKATKRDSKVSKFNYKLDIYQAIKLVLFKTLQNSELLDTRAYLKTIVHSIQHSNFVKKLAILPIINILYQNITHKLQDDEEVLPPIFIENLGNIEKCKNSLLIKNENLWKSRYNRLINLNDLIELNLEIIFGNLNQSNIDFIYNKLMITGDKTKDNIIEFIISKINDNDLNLLTSQSIDLYNNLLTIIKSESCKLNIYNIDGIYNTNLIKIVDELVQNNYSKIEILENFRIFVKGDRYKFIPNIEELFTNRDLEDRNMINNLYTSIKKAYYRKILDFNDIEFTSHYTSTNSVRNSIDRCIVTKSTNNKFYKVIGRKKMLKNNSPIQNLINMDNLTFNNMAREIYNKNTELTKCKIDKNPHIHQYNFESNKKKLNV